MGILNQFRRRIYWRIFRNRRSPGRPEIQKIQWAVKQHNNKRDKIPEIAEFPYNINGGLHKKRPHFCDLKAWCGAGLNRRHKDFQSFALPTELPHLLSAEAFAICAWRRCRRRRTPFPNRLPIQKIWVVSKGSKNRGFYEFTQRIDPFRKSK